MEAVRILVAAILLSGAVSMVMVESCGKQKTDSRKAQIPDVPLPKFLDDREPKWSDNVRRQYEIIIPKEGYQYSEMPFSLGFVEGNTALIPCKKHPVIYWAKETEESLCKVTTYFDCDGNFLSYDSSCIIK